MQNRFLSSLFIGTVIILGTAYAQTVQKTTTKEVKVPLKLYWSSGRTDNFTTATSKGEQDAINASYKFVRTMGYINKHPKDGLVPLKLYWSSSRKDNFTTATSKGEQDAINAGYKSVRIMGYI